MPVRDLAPALLSLGDLFAEASLVAHPDRPPVALDIKATEDGSFVIHLILETPSEAWDQIVDIFGSDAASALVNLKELIIGGSFGLFWLIKRLKGRSVVETQEPVAPGEGQIRLTLDDGTKLEIPAEVLALYQNVQVRKRARQVVAPLTNPGVQRLDFRSEHEVTLSLKASDIEAFEVPEADDMPLLDHEMPLVVSLASVAFTPGNKWRFTDGDNTFYAAIQDEGFLERVEHGIESFRKGDMLRCRMRIVQTQRGGNLHTEHHVVEVLEHIPRGTQLQLGGGEPPAVF